jgi:DNA-binding response OmpR family regulator
MALDVGDDAMQKPVIIGELCARIRLILRRSYFSNLQNRKNIDLSGRDFQFAGVTISPNKLMMIFESGKRERIGQKELGLICFFVSRKEMLVRRTEVVDAVWGPLANPFGRSVDQYIAKIRRKLGNECRGKIETIHSVGYRYTEIMHAREEQSSGSQEPRVTERQIVPLEKLP